MTPLDTLCPAPFHELSDAGRARVLNRLADTELFVALAAEPEGDRVAPLLFDLPGGRMAIAAMARIGWRGSSMRTDYAALPGRVLAAMLSGEDLSLMVNAGAPSEMLLEPATLRWLAEALRRARRIRPHPPAWPRRAGWRGTGRAAGSAAGGHVGAGRGCGTGVSTVAGWRARSSGGSDGRGRAAPGDGREGPGRAYRFSAAAAFALRCRLRSSAAR